MHPIESKTKADRGHSRPLRLRSFWSCNDIFKRVALGTRMDRLLINGSPRLVHILGGYLTIRPVARKGYGSIAHEAKPNGLLTRGP